MAKTHVIDGRYYVEVNRKADVGEKVIVIGGAVDQINIGKDYNVLNARDGFVHTDGFYDDESTLNLFPHEYRVLEPLESEEVTVDTTQASPAVIEMLTALSRKIVSLEQQLRDTQRNVETWAEQTESNSEDIRTLDARTQDEAIAEALMRRLNREARFKC